MFVTNSCPAKCRQIAAVPKDEYINNKKKTKLGPYFDRDTRFRTPTTPI